MNRMNRRRRRNRSRSCEYVRNIILCTKSSTQRAAQYKYIHYDDGGFVRVMRGAAEPHDSAVDVVHFFMIIVQLMSRVYKKHLTTICMAVFVHVFVGVFAVLLHESGGNRRRFDSGGGLGIAFLVYIFLSFFLWNKYRVQTNDILIFVI